MVADLGLPGAVVEMPDEAPQKALWEVRKAGLNIMMSLKGDGKPVSFIEDCAVPLEHLAEYTDALTEVFGRHGTRGTWYAHASVGTLHVRPILDMRTRRRRQDAHDRRGSERAGAQVQGRLQRRAWRRPVPRRMDRLAVRTAASTPPSGRSSSGSIRSACSPRTGSSIRRRWTMRACSAIAPCTGRFALKTVLRLVGMERAERSGSPSRPPRRERRRHRAAASPRPSRCATTTATAASSMPARCARAIGSRETRST